MQLRPGLVSVAVLTAELLAAKPHDKQILLLFGKGAASPVLPTRDGLAVNKRLHDIRGLLP